MQSPIRIGIRRPNRSDNGPTINCPTAKMARKTVMVEVTAALDTCRSAAMAGSEGRKILVARIPVAANAQITALQAVTVRCLGSVAGTSLRTTSMVIACVPPNWLSKRRGVEYLIACAATALPTGTLAILNNWLLDVVLRMLEELADRRHLALRSPSRLVR